MGLPLDLSTVFQLLAVLEFGIMIGSVLGKREAKGTSEQFLKDYRSQKRKMWGQVEKIIAGGLN